MSDELREGGTESFARARARGRRMAHALVVVVAVLFVAASARQIVAAVFELGVVPVTATWAMGSPADRTCADDLRSLATALDRASARSAVTTSSATDEAPADFRRALSPEWDRARSASLACSMSHGGLDAWASLQRLEVAEEQVARRNHAELGPLRRDLSAHLPPHLRY